MFVVAFLIVIQIAFYAVVFFSLTSYSQYINIGFRILSFIVVVLIFIQNENPAYKMPWIVLILMFPLFGGLLYILISEKKPVRFMRKKVKPNILIGKQCMNFDDGILRELYETDPNVATQVAYIENRAGFPACRDSRVEYYPSGESCFQVILEELRKAEEYIFLEYFIIEEGKMWNSVLKILEEKVKEGVDVRVMYDDVGCAFTMPLKYDEILREKGIRCQVFNRFIPVASTVFNNRDHRKILVIDGRVAFTGGINFADEYINEKVRFGYWKDNGVRITGKAVHSMNVLFLTMWNSFSEDKLDYDAFVPVSLPNGPSKGLVLPYADHPLDREIVGENVYLNMINNAVRYVYFFTPYLIIDNEMITALTLAAKRGVDVRIVTPGIPDKKMVYIVTKSYFRQLAGNGVKVYTYTPGFIHAKCAVADDKVATVGTINLDYRSLYLHFENGVFLYQCDTVLDIRNDILATIHDCKEMTVEACEESLFMEIVQGILRIFAPLM